MSFELSEEPVWEALAQSVEKFQTRVRELPIQPHATPAEVREFLAKQYDFRAPIDREPLTSQVCKLLANWTTHVTHPRYFGLFNPSVQPVSVIADALCGLYNPQLAAWSHAPAANELERLTLNELMARIGWAPNKGIGTFTSGGAEANSSALVAALAYHFPEASEDGLACLPSKPVVYLTEEAHHSFVKAVRMAGLGTGCLHHVAITEQFTMDTVALKEAIAKDLAEGYRPFMVVGTAGTTGAGLIDPLHEIGVIAHENNLWFHVDAAWGGSALLSSTLRHSLDGISLADSITWDAHKWLSVTMGAGMFFCRHPEAVHSAFSVSTSYMPPKTGDVLGVDPYATTAQWSRRAIGLKVFMALAERGMDGYGEIIDHQAEMGLLLKSNLLSSGWQVINETPMPLVCFTHQSLAGSESTIFDFVKEIQRRNFVWISHVVLGGKSLCLRACITSFQTQPEDIDFLVRELNEVLASLHGC